MTNDETRLKIAKLKGLSNVYIGDVPNWPESIADAWMLVEEMKASIEGIWFQEDDWAIIMWVGTKPNSKLRYFNASTIELAASLAYIPWKESQK